MRGRRRSSLVVVNPAVVRDAGTPDCDPMPAQELSPRRNDEVQARTTPRGGT
jgi:hypothetical protein